MQVQASRTDDCVGKWPWWVPARVIHLERLSGLFSMGAGSDASEPGGLGFEWWP